MIIKRNKKITKKKILTILIFSFFLINQEIFARERNEIYSFDENNNSLRPPFSDCRSMQAYFNKKYASRKKRTTFNNFENKYLTSSKLDYSSRSLERGLYALKDNVITCSGGNILVKMKTDRGVDFEKICTKSKIYYYTLSNGKTILSWSDKRIINAIFNGKEWKRMGYLYDLISEGECDYNF